MKSVALLMFVAALVSASALSGCRRQSTSRLPTDAVAEDTSLGPGDVFEVRVFGEKDMSGKYQVGPQGTIEFPFVGSVRVLGKEASAVSRELAERLKAGGFLNDPQISIFVEETNSKRISVLGAIAKPGTLPIIPGMTVVQAVSQAGGFTALANKDETVVTRRRNGKLERYRITVTSVMRGDAEDFALRAGDIVFVPERIF